VSDPYFSTLKYRGRDGQLVELEYQRTTPVQNRGHWWYRLQDLEQGPFSSKFSALIDAAHSQGLSGKDMNWEPVVGDPKTQLE
jgi:hypothetical protein